MHTHLGTLTQNALGEPSVSVFNSLSLFFLKILFIHERHTEREREREKQRYTQEKQAPHREPDAGLDPGTPGSLPGPKAGTKPLSHPGIPGTGCYMQVMNH